MKAIKSLAIWTLCTAMMIAPAVGIAQEVAKGEALTVENVAVGQSIADAIRSSAGTDISFIASGHIKEKYDGRDLVPALLYPTDEIVVLNLTGKQLKQAFERSLVFYPAPNASFLYLSGVDVQFKAAESANDRVISISVGGSPVDPTKTYSVSMPASLGRGGLGYFKIWDSKSITKTLATTMEKVLAQKSVVQSVSRWQSKG